MADNVKAKSATPYLKIVELTVPWILFTTLLLWGWRIGGLFKDIPAYGDVLEVLWGIEWYGTHIPHESPFYCPLLFHPQGWHVAAFAFSPGIFAGLTPLYLFGGAAFAFNAAGLLCFFVSFAGMYRLAKRLTRSPLSATIASLLFTFWGFRWSRIYGHLNILLASSLLPWMAWSLERALRQSRKPLIWFVLTGGLWGLGITNALYFTWLGGMLILGWLAGHCLGRGANWRTILKGGLVTALVALTLSAPTLFLFLRASEAAAAPFHDIREIDHWGARLNSLPIPFITHPWLKPIARWVYRGPIDESGAANLGFAAFILAIIGLQSIWRERRWRPVLTTICLGLLLGVGFNLKWDEEVARCQLLEPLNTAIWQIGHQLKPQVFGSPTPPPPFDTAIPMPGLILAAIVPFWEGARGLSRYIFIAGTGFFALAAYGIKRFRSPIVQIIIAALLIVEIVPPPAKGVPFPNISHPAFDWLAQQSLPHNGVIDLYSPRTDILTLSIRGETLWATRYHGKATVAGTSSVIPAHTLFLSGWFRKHPHPLQHPDFAPLLRYYRVDLILLHMTMKNEKQVLEEAQNNEEIELVRCFDPPPAPSPWPYPICVIEILPPANPRFNALLREGWSGEEPWGIWADGTTSRARWVATAQTDHSLLLEAFPHCVPNETQSLTIEVNGQQLLTHQWKDCEPWSQEVIIPPSLIQIGWNDIWFHYDYAIRPVDLAGGENPDPRQLSVGFTQLEIRQR